MADDSHENGTSNGDVPEIELIIKVSLYYAWNEDEEGERDREKKAIVSCTIWAWIEWLVFFLYFLLLPPDVSSSSIRWRGVAVETTVSDEDTCASFIVYGMENREAASSDHRPFTSSVEPLLLPLFSSPFLQFSQLIRWSMRCVESRTNDNKLIFGTLLEYGGRAWDALFQKLFVFVDY